MPITIQSAIRDASARISAASASDSPLLDAQVIMRFVLGINRTALLMRYADDLSSDAQASFTALIDRRLAGEPVAYITGEREFMGLSFRTTADVLIPRPDTEPLVEWALAWLEDHPASTVVDIGTGSGAIAISLLAHAPMAFTGDVIAIDTSPRALAIAAENADRLLSPDRRGRIGFRLGSLTQPLEEPIDLLLANLPYLTPRQIASNPDLDQEPRLALDGGADGLDLIRTVIADLPRLLTPCAAAGFEIDPSQADAMRTLAGIALPGIGIRIIPDLAQKSRHVVLERSP